MKKKKKLKVKPNIYRFPSLYKFCISFLPWKLILDGVHETWRNNWNVGFVRVSRRMQGRAIHAVCIRSLENQVRHVRGARNFRLVNRLLTKDCDRIDGHLFVLRVIIISLIHRTTTAGIVETRNFVPMEISSWIYYFANLSLRSTWSNLGETWQYCLDSLREFWKEYNIGINENNVVMKRLFKFYIFFACYKFCNGLHKEIFRGIYRFVPREIILIKVGNIILESLKKRNDKMFYWKFFKIHCLKLTFTNKWEWII